MPIFKKILSTNFDSFVFFFFEVFRVSTHHAKILHSESEGSSSELT